MSEISNAFEHFIVLLMKSDSHFLNKGDSCILGDFENASP